MLRHASALLFAFAIATSVARADEAAPTSPTPSPSPPPSSSTDVTADESLISPVRTYTIQGTYTPSVYGPTHARVEQVIQRLAVFYVGKYLMRVTLPRLQTINGIDSGYGDLQMFYLLSTSIQRGSYAGIFVSLPTGSPQLFSSQKWLIGPALAHIFESKRGVRTVGVLLQTAFSVAGPRSAPNQAAISLLPFATVKFKNGWFLKTPESPWLFDLQRGQTLIALGGGFGKSIQLVELPCLLSITDEGTIVHANVPNAPKNTLRLTLTFVLTQR